LTHREARASFRGLPVPRLSPLSPAELGTDAQRSLEAIAAERGRVPSLFHVLLRSPLSAQRAAELGAQLRFHSRLADDRRELVILATARHLGCDYEWSIHRPLALDAGVDDATLAALEAGREPALDAYLVLTRYTRQLLDERRVDDHTFDACHAMLGDEGIIDLTLTVGYYAMLAGVVGALRIETEKT
jgi:4-carboxymuconolactone decarboxylase